MAFVPHWVRPVLIAWLVLLWTAFEVGFRSLLGILSWLDVPSPVHLGPQARQAVLTLEFHQRELVRRRPGEVDRPCLAVLRGPVPSAESARGSADLANPLAPGCLVLPMDEPVPRLKSSAREMARRVWIARHWEEERIVDLWASCVATSSRPAVSVFPRSSVSPALFISGPMTRAGGALQGEVGDRRQSAALGILWLEMPELRAIPLTGVWGHVRRPSSPSVRAGAAALARGPRPLKEPAARDT